jgi:hypothetical protein
MENFYEANLILTAQVVFKKDADVRDEMLLNIQLASQRVLQQLASDNDFLISNIRVIVCVPFGQEV